MRVQRLTRGLFILRYAASNPHGISPGGPAGAPTIRLAPQNPADVELIGWPDAAPNELLGPGDGLVIRAYRDTTIAFEVVPAISGGSVDAELHLEPVSRLAYGGFTRRDDSAARNRAELHDVDTDKIEILAHVSRRGDVITPAGDWICGPEYPMAIEGLEIRWPGRPAGVDLVTHVSVSKNGIRNLPARSIGEFAGTRGRAAPITGVELSLTGERAGDFVLRADALFLGSSVQSRSGRSVAMSGPTGREPLVGLRLSVAATGYGAARQAATPAAQERPKAASNWNSGGRIRVFRGLKKGSPAPLIS